MPLDAYWAIAAALGWIVAAIFVAYAFGQATQLRDARDQIASFDHDGDGKIGGSRKR